jgi:hypothetical protein
MTDLNHVDAVLVAMIKAYPTLRGSRLDCLENLASGSTEYDVRWNEDGSLWVNEEKTARSGRPDKSEDQDEQVIAGLEDIANEKVGSIFHRGAVSRHANHLLFLRSQAVKEKFNVDNAEEIILAGTSYDPDFKDYPNAYGWENSLPSGGYRLLDTIPENADPLWIAAFTELMDAILWFEYPEHKWKGMSADYAKSRLDGLERAKSEARDILVRIKGTDKEKTALVQANVQKQIDALIAQAAKQGVKIEATIV